MCGRYRRVFSDEEIRAQFDAIIDRLDAEPSYNIAPGTFQPVVRQTTAGRVCDPLWWGLVPYWAKERSFGAHTINARAETVASRPAFRRAFRMRRCLVPADGYYEWKASGGRKQPWLFQIAGGAPFAFGGLWESWGRGEDELRSFCLITTPPNELAASVHDRMPLIIPRDRYARWLDPRLQDPAALEELLQPYPAGGMTAIPVSPLVSNAKNQGPEVSRPLS